MHYQFRPEEERRIDLSETEHRKLVSLNPRFKSVSKSIYFDNYDLPCPIMVEVLREDGSTETVVLRKARHGDVQKEVVVLKALRNIGLPVPHIFAEPFQNESGEWCSIYSLLPGENLQKLSSASEEGLQQAKVLLVEAVLRLAAAGEAACQGSLCDLPRITMVEEFEKVKEKENTWLKNPLYATAIEFLESRLAAVTTPLILTNGDYQPGNFLAANGQITGFLDFESPSFQDPMMGFVKYPIYDLRPLSRTDIIDCFLEKAGFSKKEFSLRLVLGCLKILKKEIPPEGGDEETKHYRNRVLSMLKAELEKNL